MKVILDLKKSFNNYYWKDKEELEDYIKYMKNELWEMYNETDEIMSENKHDRLYDILDMFEKFEVKEWYKWI